MAKNEKPKLPKTEPMKTKPIKSTIPNKPNTKSSNNK